MTTSVQWEVLVQAHEAVTNYRRVAHRPAIGDINLYEFLLNLSKEHGFNVKDAFDFAVDKDFILWSSPESWEYDQDLVIEFLTGVGFIKEEEE